MSRNASSRHAPSKPDQHPTYLACPADEFPFRWAGDEPEIGSQLDVRSEFVGGAKRDIEESRHIAVASPATAFGDVGRNGDCSSPCLMDQPEPLRVRKGIRSPVHQYRKRFAFVPDRQLHEVIHNRPIRPENLYVKTGAVATVPRHRRIDRLGLARDSAYCLLIAAYQ